MDRVVVIVGLLLVVVNVHAGNNEEALETFKKCQKEVGASDEEVEPLINKQPPETTNAKCVVECMLVKAGVINNGKYDSEKGKAMIEKFLKDNPEKQDIAKKAAEECGKEVEDVKLGKCEGAVKMTSCFKEKFGKSGKN